MREGAPEADVSVVDLRTGQTIRRLEMDGFSLSEALLADDLLWTRETDDTGLVQVWDVSNSVPVEQSVVNRENNWERVDGDEDGDAAAPIAFLEQGAIVQEESGEFNDEQHGVDGIYRVEIMAVGMGGNALACARSDGRSGGSLISTITRASKGRQWMCRDLDLGSEQGEEGVDALRFLDCFGNLFLTASCYGVVRLWDVKAQSCLNLFRFQTMGVMRVDCDSRCMAVTYQSDDGDYAILVRDFGRASLTATASTLSSSS